MPDKKKINPAFQTTYFHLEMSPQDDAAEIVADIHVHRPDPVTPQSLSSKTPATETETEVHGIVCDKTRVQMWDLNGLTYADKTYVSVKWCTTPTSTSTSTTQARTRIRIDVKAFGFGFWVVCEEGEGGDGKLVVKEKSHLTRNPFRRPNDPYPFDIVKCLTKTDVGDNDCGYKALPEDDPYVPRPGVTIVDQYTFYEVVGAEMLKMGKEERKKLDRKGF